MKVLPLAEIQRRFKTAVTGEKKPWKPEDLALRDQPPVPFTERVRIYQYAYAARLGDSLKEDFSAVLNWIGEKAFNACVRPYLNAVPPTDSIIAEVSQSFPEYLALFPLPDAPPFLSELARFEWDCVQSAMVDDRNPPGVRSLAEMSEADPAQARLATAPSLRLFQSDWPVDRYLQRTKAFAPKTSYLALNQCEEGTQWLRLGRRQYAILGEIQSGIPVPQLLTQMGKARVTPAQTQAWFQTWSARGIIRGYFSHPLSA